MNSNKLIARAIFRNVLQKRNGSSYKSHHKVATMNDLPKPEGDFFILYAKRQSKNNAVLGLGIVSITSSLYVWYTSGLNKLYASPPDTYE